jgi:hypothetical protein
MGDGVSRKAAWRVRACKKRSAGFRSGVMSLPSGAPTRPVDESARRTR